MKNLLSAMLLVALPTLGFGQKKVEITFQTDGVCGMCEKRIEKALLDLDGVWTADWNQETHATFVVYNPKKVSEMDLYKAVAGVGHDTPKVKAKDEDYAKVHACCKYRDEEVNAAHHGG
ncbi:MAG TPA: ATPase [Cryomorphaceae bacterium]|nr:ATPase [Cryomorphaceae bacterium]